MSEAAEGKRESPGGRIEAVVQIAVLTAFIVMMTVGIAAHEPWLDEAQSWLLVRDLSPAELLLGRLRYEGHPAGWYLLILPLAKLGAPYWSQSLLAAVVALVGVAMLLQLRDVPLVLRAAAPLGYYFVYQYTVVARSYVMLIPLLAAMAMIYPHRAARPITFAALLIVMTQVSVFSAAMAVGLCALAVVDVLRGRLVLRPDLRTRYVAAVAALAVNGLLLVVMLYPPDDLVIAPKIEASMGSARTFVIANMVAKDVTFASPWAAWVSVVAVAVWAWNRGALAELAVMWGALLSLVTVYFNVWHEGLFMFALTFVMWLGYARPLRPHRFSRLIERVGLAALVLISLQHVRWGAAALVGEVRDRYSGSAAAAEFIEERGLRDGTLYGVGFPAIAIQPYFESNIFDNYDLDGGYAFWDWSNNAPWYFRPAVARDIDVMRAWVRQQLAESPDYVLVALKFQVHNDVNLLEVANHPDYQVVAVFPGHILWKGQPWQPDSYVLFAHRRTKLARETGPAVGLPP